MSGRNPRYLLLVLVLAVLTCLAALLALDLAAPDTAEGPNGTLASQDETTAGQDAAQKAASDSVNDMLASRIKAIAREDTTHYALFVAYPLENRPHYIYQSSQMRSASMMFSVKQISPFSSSEFPIVIVGKSPLSADLVRKQVPLLHPAA